MATKVDLTNKNRRMYVLGKCISKKYLVSLRSLKCCTSRIMIKYLGLNSMFVKDIVI